MWSVLWEKLKEKWGGTGRSGWNGRKEEGWREVLNGVVWVDLFEKLAFDQHLRKVGESKGRAFQVKGTATAWGLPLRREGEHARGTPSPVLRDQCRERPPWMMLVSSCDRNSGFLTSALAFWNWNAACFFLGSLSTTQKGSILTSWCCLWGLSISLLTEFPLLLLWRRNTLLYSP